MAGICRICVVEVEGQRNLQAACAYPVTAPIKIKTYSKAVRIARRHVLDLLLSEHCGDCYSCIRNGICELQKLAEEYGVDSFRFGHVEVPVGIDDSSYSIVRDMNKCIRCRRCVRTCIDMQEVGVLEAMNRSNKVEISTFLQQAAGRRGLHQLRPVHQPLPHRGPLREPGPRPGVESAGRPHQARGHPDRSVAAGGHGRVLRPRAGTSVTYQMNTALRRMGFDHVFDTNFTADLTIIEEGTELIIRLYKALVEGDTSVALPQLTSCSPGWVKYCEHFYPEFIPNLSSAKSPQQMFGALIKTFYAEKLGLDPANIVSVALMPCSAKKFECNRPEMTDSGYKDVDFGLTTRELGKMFHQAGLDVPTMPKSDFDDPFGGATGSGLIFGATGGVMESALRTVLELVTGRKLETIYEHGDIMPVRGFEGVRYAELTIDEVGPVPDSAQAPRAQLGLAQGGDGQGGGGPRHRQRQEGHGGHQGRRQVQPVPLHRVHGLPGRLPRRRRPAHPDQQGDPGGARQGHLRRRPRARPFASRTRTRRSRGCTRNSSPTGRAATRATNCCTLTTWTAASTWSNTGRTSVAKGEPTGSPFFCLVPPSGSERGRSTRRQA